MQNKQVDQAMQTTAKSGGDRNKNQLSEAEQPGIKEENIENTHSETCLEREHAAALYEQSQQEKRIDHGNEHHHHTDADYKIFDEYIDRSTRSEANSMK
ncbi:MAG: hypothetical protein ABI416_15500 [Ginsengibacter sp.]